MTAETISTSRREREKTCVHHWIVETAEGPTSAARCKLCGRERTFSNSPEAANEELMRTAAAAESQAVAQ